LATAPVVIDAVRNRLIENRDANDSAEKAIEILRRCERDAMKNEISLLYTPAPCAA
jgi:hypothetical protein